MFVWLISSALCSPGYSAVREVVWARPFELAVPGRYRHASPGREFRRGWLLELRVDPDTMISREIGMPLLWIGRDVAVRTLWNDPHGCAVVWVPGDHDLRTELVFFGSDGLPEQQDREGVEAEHRRARESGIVPLPAARIGDVKEERIALPDERALAALAADRGARCGR